MEIQMHTQIEAKMRHANGDTRGHKMYTLPHKSREHGDSTKIKWGHNRAKTATTLLQT